MLRAELLREFKGNWAVFCGGTLSTVCMSVLAPTWVALAGT